MPDNRPCKELLEHRRSVSLSIPKDTDGLLEKASDPDAEVRAAVAMKFAHEDDPRAIPALLTLLEDESPRTRRAAALALGINGGDEARPVLLRHLRDDPSPVVRWSCALHLSASGDEDTIQALTQALSDEDPQVRGGACSALSTSTRVPLDEIQKLLDDDQWTVLLHAVDVLCIHGAWSGKLLQTVEGLRKIDEARGTARTIAVANAIVALSDSDCEEIARVDAECPPDEDLAGEELLYYYRQKLGPDIVPEVPMDPLAERAEEIRAHLQSQRNTL